MKIPKVLTKQEFEHVMAAMRLTLKHKKIAKAVLVDRLPIQTVAAQKEMTQQAVAGTVRRVWLKFLELEDVPKGWVTLRVSLPKEEAIKVQQHAAKLKTKYIADQRMKID